jgi:septal ring factor EnvC (AmiA/AmiB activator)
MKAKKLKITEEGVLAEDIKQLMTPQAIEELKDLSPTLQQFLLRWQDKRDLILTEQIKEELKEFFLDLTDSNTKIICDEITAHVCKQVGETITPIYEALGQIADGINDIKKDIGKIKLDIIDIKKRLEQVETQVSDEEKRIQKLERYASLRNTILRIVLGILIGVSLALILSYLIFR